MVDSTLPLDQGLMSSFILMIAEIAFTIDLHHTPLTKLGI